MSTNLSSGLDRMLASRFAWSAVLAALFLAAVLVRLSAFTGLLGSDDLWYARYARAIAGGTFPLETNQFAGRTGVTLPLAAVYRLFGVSEATTVVLPLLASSASVVLLAAIGARLYSPLAGLLAALLLASSPIDIRYATILVPESLMGFWILVALWCFVAARARASLIMAAAAGAATGVAYLTKEPAAFVTLALVLTALVGGQRALSLAVALGALAVVIAEAGAYQVVFGDPFHRIAAARVGVIELPAHESGSVTAGLVERLFKTYPRMMVYPTREFGFHYPVALGAAAAGLLLVRRERLLVLLWAGLPWLFLNFGSASLDRYMPLWPTARYIGLTLPPLFILGAAALTAPPLTRHALRRWLVGGVIVGACAAGPVLAMAARAKDSRAPTMAALRSIANAASASHTPLCREWADSGDVIRYGDTRLEVWSSALAVLAPAPNDMPTPRLILERDALGLPMVREGVCGLVPEVWQPHVAGDRTPAAGEP